MYFNRCCTSRLNVLYTILRCLENRVIIQIKKSGELASKSKTMKPFLNNFFNFLHFRRQTVFFAVLGAVFVLVFILSPIHRAEAQVMSKVAGLVADALGWLLGSVIFPLLGWVLKWILEALVSVAEYNKIINQSTIQNTWGTVRDIVNMFFIFAMLLIAFSTILRYQQYEVKKMLPKLVLYAVLVNFSLTICGLFIDIAQVFTLTFVNAFKDNAVNNFTQSVNIFDFTSMSSDLRSGINAATVMGGYLLALVLMIVTLVTLGAMVLMLLVRIVYLWILSILSPFAFVLPVIPGGQKYASQWWDMFSKQVITGPLLAFFIWLSLSVLANTGNIGNEILNSATKSKMTADLTGTGLKTTNTDFIIHFIISIAMMFIGLMLTSQMGGAAGKIAGAASNWMQKSGTGLITGRLGPTPMRWARERYGAWRGQRESIRKEKVSRFGQGASALQDFAINKNIGHKLSQLYKYPAGAIGRGMGRYAKQVHRGLGGSEESLIGKGLKTTSEWRPGQKDRWRAMERVEKYKDSTFNSDVQTILKAKRVSSIGDDQGVRDLEAEAGTELEHAAYAIELGNRRALGRDEHDVNYTEEGVERKGLISRTSRFLERVPEMKQKFDDSIKKISPDLAAKTDIYVKPDGKLNYGEVESDALQGKIDLSAFTKELIDKLDQSMPGSGKGKIFSDLIKAVHDTKEMNRIFGSISKELASEYMDEIGDAIKSAGSEMRIAFGQATGHFKHVFDVKEKLEPVTITHDDGTKETKMIPQYYSEDGSMERFFSRPENRAMFTKGYGTKFENKELYEFLHRNYLKYEFTGNQWNDMYQDAKTRESIEKITPEYVEKYNKDLASYNLDYGEDNGRAYGIQRGLNHIISFLKSDKYTDKNGNRKEIYSLHDPNSLVAEAAHTAMIENIHQNRLSAERLENMDVYMVNEKGVRQKDSEGNFIMNEALLSAVAEYEGAELGKLFKESRKRGETVLEYMVKDIKTYEKHKGTVDRLNNNNALVHMITSELRKQIKKIQNDFEAAEAAKAAKGSTKEEEAKEKAKKEKKEAEEEAKKKPPPTSGGSSPFGV